MPTMFVSKSGATYPATAADFRRAKAGDVDKVKWARAEAGKPLAAPYPEIVASWLANGFEEVKGSGVSER